MNREDGLSPDFARILNLLGMSAMIGVLLGAYVYQFAYRELPCTLCQLQRVGMLAVAFGAAMNVMLGPSPRNYGVCLVSAVFGLGISIRQTLLHIDPFFDTTKGEPTLVATSNPPFGQPVWGLHLYVWGIVLFSVVILAVAIMQLFKGQFRATASTPDRLARLAGAGLALLAALAVVETATTFMECGLVDCPNDGSWNWWLFS